MASIAPKAHDERPRLLRHRRPCRRPVPGFEETLGTRWVVWIGGLTLALGGFFMVRYSIEAGLLGPGVRTMLGGLSRWRYLRPANGPGARKASRIFAALADRQHPAILTAAGTR